MSNTWGAMVLRRFDGAATQYNQAARLQAAMAWRLAGHCKRLPIPSGRWLDLGSGTGLLADAIEQRNPGRVVERIDGSPSMLARSSRPDHTQLWDLNQPLQSWDAHNADRLKFLPPLVVRSRHKTAELVRVSGPRWLVNRGAAG